MLVWSKNSSGLAVPETLSYFNADEFTEETGISCCAATPPLPLSSAHTQQWREMLGNILPTRAAKALLAG